jgi:hypothetical protein
MNTQVPDVEEPQLFRVSLKGMGDEAALLDAREVYFIVPPSMFSECGVH